MNAYYRYLWRKFTQPRNDLIWLILIHIVSFLLFCIVDTICYICGCAKYIPLCYQQLAFPSLYSLLLGHPWTIITYTFVHTSFLNLFWDMLMLYGFGQNIGKIVDVTHLWRLYVVGQVAGALAFFLLYQYSPPFKNVIMHLMGPTAAIYAIMIALCVLMPTLKINFYFVFVPLRYIAAALLTYAFMRLTSNEAGDYLAQLGGAVAGYIYAKGCIKDRPDKKIPFFKQNLNKPTLFVSITKQQDSK